MLDASALCSFIKNRSNHVENVKIYLLKTGDKTANINVKNCSLYTFLTVAYRKQQKSQKTNINQSNIDI